MEDQKQSVQAEKKPEQKKPSGTGNPPQKKQASGSGKKPKQNPHSTKPQKNAKTQPNAPKQDSGNAANQQAAVLQKMQAEIGAALAEQTAMLKNLADTVNAQSSLREKEAVKVLEAELRLQRSRQNEQSKLLESREQELSGLWQKYHIAEQELGGLRQQLAEMQRSLSETEAARAESDAARSQLEEALHSAAAMHKDASQQVLMEYQAKLRRALAMPHEDFEEFRDCEMNEENYASLITILRSVFRALSANGISF